MIQNLLGEIPIVVGTGDEKGVFSRSVVLTQGTPSGRES